MVLTEKINKVSKGRVHLHVHLDGAVRIATIWELSRKKNLPLPGSGSLRDLQEELAVHGPKDLAFFLSKFRYITPAIISDLEAIERVAFEFVEDEARQGVLYCEPRFSPYLLTSPDSAVSARDVLQAVLRGLARGEQQTGTAARVILCCIIGMQQHYAGILELCTEFRPQVVGIDIAGDEASTARAIAGSHADEIMKAEIEVFQEAARRGIHRTAHSAEYGPASHVQMSLDLLKAERIGHGYHVIDDDAIYQRCLKAGVHFECCPISSFMTGAVPLSQTKHPIQRFCEDGASFSISEDDPSVTQRGLDGEYAALRRMGFNEADFARANFNAAMACFLPDPEKKELLNKLKQVYGVPSNVSTLSALY